MPFCHQLRIRGWKTHLVCSEMNSVALPCARRTDHARPLLWHELVAITQADVTHMISYTSLEAWCPRRRLWSRSVSRKQNVRSIVENAHLDNIECNCLHLCLHRQGQQHQVRLCLTRTLRRESKPLNMHPVRRWFSERPGPKASSKDMYVGIRAPCCHLRI